MSLALNKPKLDNLTDEIWKSAEVLAKLVKGLETSTAPFSNKTGWTLRRDYKAVSSSATERKAETHGA